MASHKSSTHMLSTLSFIRPPKLMVSWINDPLWLKFHGLGSFISIFVEPSFCFVLLCCSTYRYHSLFISSWQQVFEVLSGPHQKVMLLQKCVNSNTCQRSQQGHLRGGSRKLVKRGPSAGRREPLGGSGGMPPREILKSGPSKRAIPRLSRP